MKKKRALEDRVISTYNFEDFLGWEILRKAYVLDTSIAELLPCIFMSSSGQHIYIHAKNNDYEAEELGYSNKVSKLQPIKTFRNREAGARLSNLESFLDAVKSPSLVVVSNSGSGLNITELVGAADVEDADFSKVDINVFALPELEVVNLAPYAVEELDGKKIVNLYLPEGSNLISMIVYLDKERKEKLFHGLDYIIEQDKTHGWYRLVFLNNKAISEVYCSANCSAPKIAPRIDLSTFPVNNDMLNSLIEEYGIEVIKQLLEKVMNDKTDLTVQDIADVIYGSMQYGFSNDSHTPIPANPKLGFAPVVDQDTNKIIAQCDLAELMAMAYVQPNLPLEIRDQIYAANLITRSPYAPFNKDGLAYILMGIPHTSMRADVMVRGDRQVMDVDLTPALPADMLSIQNLKIDEIIGASAAEQNDNHNYKRNFIKERLASLYDVFSRYSIIDGSVDMSGFEKFENVTEFSVPTLEQIRSNLGKGAKGLPHTLYYSLLLYLKKEQENGKNILQILEDGQVINLLEKIIEDATMFADVARDPDRNRRKIIESIHIPSGIYNVILNEAKRLRGFLEKSIK